MDTQKLNEKIAELESELKVEKEKNAFFSAIVKNVPGVVYQYIVYPDDSSKFTFIEGQVESVYGYTSEQVKENVNLAFERIHPEDIASLYENIEKSKAGSGYFEWIGRIRSTSGKVTWIRALSEARHDSDGTIVWNGFFADISALKKAQGKLQDSHNFLKAVLDAIADPIFIKDKEHRWIEFNSSFSNFLGRAREELLGKSDYEYFPKKEADVFWRYDDIAFQTGEVIENEESLTDAFGKEHCISTKKKVCRISEEQEILVGVIRDITELKKKDAVIREQQAKLLRVAKLSALGEMAGGIAHEINNPLAVLSTANSRAKRLANENKFCSVEVRELLKKQEFTIQRVAEIIKGLRSIAKDDSAEELKPNDIYEIIHNTLNFSRDRIKKHEVGLCYKPAAEPLYVLCRATEISQVFLNIFNNAVDALKETNDPYIEICVEEKADNRVYVSVCNNGPSISEELELKIMEPFFTTKGLGKGIGLGLSISKNILDEHGGQLTLQQENDTVCFEFSLRRWQD